MCPAIAAAEERARLRIEHARIGGVEEEEAHRVAQVEHVPRRAAIVGDVAARHIAGGHHGAAVMRTHGGVEDAAASARSNHAPCGRGGQRSGGEQQ